MYAIVTKYVQIFCIAIFFDNVSCDQMLLKEAQNDFMLIQETACMALCMIEQSQQQRVRLLFIVIWLALINKECKL